MSYSVLMSFGELADGAKIALFGAGETGQEFVKKLRNINPNVEVVCFFDSYRAGAWSGIPIRKAEKIANLEAGVDLIITSIFWNEISDFVEQKFGKNHKILSNDLINQASHLSSYGSFYFDQDEDQELEARLAAINGKFQTVLDREILRRIFDLRVYRKEKEFFEYASVFVRDHKKTFATSNKYSNYIDFNDIRYVIEGGVFDGIDTFTLLQELKDFPDFKMVHAFDPFLGSLHAGKYFEKIDPNFCTFHSKVLWDVEENVSFRVNRMNPSNSTVLREAEFGADMRDSEICRAITVDGFAEQNDIAVDLIKLDVEGSEMKVLHGAKNTIKKYRPKMAVSLYHCREHLLEIPEFLSSLHEDYTYLISINNPSFVDMVLYAS